MRELPRHLASLAHGAGGRSRTHIFFGRNEAPSPLDHTGVTEYHRDGVIGRRERTCTSTLSVINRLLKLFKLRAEICLEPSRGLEPPTSTLRKSCSTKLSYDGINGAGDRSRTCDIHITSVALCQLSYTGIKMAGQVGVEPTLAVLETAVLP